jgi:hypothetical protein
MRVQQITLTLGAWRQFIRMITVSGNNMCIGQRTEQL